MRYMVRSKRFASMILSFGIFCCMAGQALAGSYVIAGDLDAGNYAEISAIQTVYSNAPAGSVDPAAISSGKLYVPERKEVTNIRMKVSAHGAYTGRRITYKTSAGQNGTLMLTSGSDWTVYIPVGNTITFMDPQTRDTLMTLRVYGEGGPTERWYWEEGP